MSLLRLGRDSRTPVAGIVGSCRPAPFLSRMFIASCAVLIVSEHAEGQISITSGVTYTQNFDSMGSTGTTTPSGWTVGTQSNATTTPLLTGSVSANTTVVVGTGSSNAGGNYNFGVAGTNPVTERALGSLASGSLERETFATFINNTGSAILSLTISYDGEQWRAGTAGNVNTLTLQYSADGTTWTNLGATFNFIAPNLTSANAALDGNAATNRIAGLGGIFIPASNIAANATFYLRWVDVDDAGSDPALAVDNFNLSATPVPEPTTWLAGALLVGAVGWHQRRRLQGLWCAAAKA